MEIAHLEIVWISLIFCLSRFNNTMCNCRYLMEPGCGRVAQATLSISNTLVEVSETTLIVVS